ncbi:MAG: hypothetical protein QOG53_1873 [Frankiales bacterium]|jgi:hypothetical protein|nr:hypothetical protein [Frankiales bacterium]
MTRTLREADDIVAGRVRIFGKILNLGDVPVWHRAPDTGGAWPRDPWWTIDLRSEDRIADVKWTWEIGRHRHLVVLARAAACGDAGVYLPALERQLEGWFATNAPEQGVHWYSNLELALRTIAWLQVHAIVGDQLSPTVREGLRHYLWHTGRHLVADLPYTATSMRNNHLLGDALGLMVLGVAFGRVGPSQRWWTLGQRLFRSQLRRHMRPDGSMVEDSLSYHRFVLEMLIVRALIGDTDAEERTALVNAAQFLCRYGVLEGPVPQHGDWDEGRVIASSGDPLDSAGSVALALAIAGSGASSEWRNSYDECAWYAAPGEPVAPEPGERNGWDVGAHIGRVQSHQLVAWLKMGSSSSHGHADLGHVSVRAGRQWLLIDSGTGNYNADIDERNYFRGGSAHNVLRSATRDQLVPHRAFRWQNTADGVLGVPITIGDTVIMWGVHDAYRDLTTGAGRVARAVLVNPAGVVVVDWPEARMPTWNLALTFGPGLDVEQSPQGASFTVTGEGVRLAVVPAGSSDVVRGVSEPRAGWWSETYGSVAPVDSVLMRGNDSDHVCWALSLAEPAKVVSNGDRVQVDGIDLEIRWDSEGAELVVQGVEPHSSRLTLKSGRRR